MIKWFAIIDSNGTIETCSCEVEETARQWRLVRDCPGYEQCYRVCGYRQTFHKGEPLTNLYRDSELDALNGLHDAHKQLIAREQERLNKKIAALHKIAEVIAAA